MKTSCIDDLKDAEYSLAAYVHGKCINAAGELWHAPGQAEWRSGALSTTAEESAMLCGVAAWLNWQDRRRELGKPTDRPNFVVAADGGELWEHFAELWHIEMRTVVHKTGYPMPDVDDTVKLCDENTIFVVAMARYADCMLNDDVQGLSHALDEAAHRGSTDADIIVDANGAAFLLPFLADAPAWDFRVKRVTAIMGSGMEGDTLLGGLWWVCWRSMEHLPTGMLFSVEYLGLEIKQVGLNFSRPTLRYADRYFRYVRMGKDGFRAYQLGLLERQLASNRTSKRGVIRYGVEEADGPIREGAAAVVVHAVADHQP